MGNKLCVFMKTCHPAKINRPITPTIIGNKVAADFQGYWIPPHERPTRKLVMLPTKRVAPTQSVCFIFCANDNGDMAFKRTKKIATMKPIPQNGKLMIKHLFGGLVFFQFHRSCTHQRQEAFSTSDPPMSGPMMVPIDHISNTSEKYLGRTLKGTMSQNMTWVRVMIPPPPTPWIQRPVNMTVKSQATVHRMMPTVKQTREMRSNCWRPQKWESEATTGWKTAEVRR